MRKINRQTLIINEAMGYLQSMWYLFSPPILQFILGVLGWHLHHHRWQSPLTDGHWLTEVKTTTIHSMLNNTQRRLARRKYRLTWIFSCNGRSIVRQNWVRRAVELVKNVTVSKTKLTHDWGDAALVVRAIWKLFECSDNCKLSVITSSFGNCSPRKIRLGLALETDGSCKLKTKGGRSSNFFRRKQIRGCDLERLLQFFAFNAF